MPNSDKQYFIFRRKYSCKNASCSKLKYWQESWQSVSLSVIRGALLPLLWNDKIYKRNLQRKIILAQSMSCNLMRGDDYFIYRHFHGAHQQNNQDALEVQTVVAMIEGCVNNYISVHRKPAAFGVRKWLLESWMRCVWINVTLKTRATSGFLKEILLLMAWVVCRNMALLKLLN